MLSRLPPEGEGLMYARGSVERCGIRVLSPNIEPPVLDDDGSTAYSEKMIN